MNNIKLASLLEANKLSTNEAWIALIEIFPSPTGSPTEVLRLAANNEDVTFQGNVYTAFNFIIDTISNKTTGELSNVVLRVSNVNRLVQSEIENFNGGVDATVNLYMVNSSDPGGEPELETQFTIVSTSCDETYVTFTLGAENPMRRLFPRFINMADYCMWVYNTPAMQESLDPAGLECGYEGALTSCTKRLHGDNGCRAHNNSQNFGGYPGVEVSGYRRALA